MSEESLSLEPWAARSRGVAGCPRRGGVWKTNGDPRLRGDDIWLQSGGFVPLFSIMDCFASLAMTFFSYIGAHSERI